MLYLVSLSAIILIAGNHSILSSTSSNSSYVNGIPFTYDELEDVIENDVWIPSIKIIADNETKYNTEDLFNHHAYLMEEECHPLVFDLELENPEKLPVD